MNTLMQLAILVINIFIYAGMFYLLYRFLRKIPGIDLYLMSIPPDRSHSIR